jgi:hypothetical protein
VRASQVSSGMLSENVKDSAVSTYRKAGLSVRELEMIALLTADDSRMLAAG